MHIPARYYKHIPKFYFIAGFLLIWTSFNMEDNPLGAYLYFMAGAVSMVYAATVFFARRKGRRQRPPDDLRPMPVEEKPVVEKRPEFVNDNAQAVAQAGSGEASASEAEAQPQSDADESELPQHGGGVAAAAQSEVKS